MTPTLLRDCFDRGRPLRAQHVASDLTGGDVRSSSLWKLDDDRWFWGMCSSHANFGETWRVMHPALSLSNDSVISILTKTMKTCTHTRGEEDEGWCPRYLRASLTLPHASSWVFRRSQLAITGCVSQKSIREAHDVPSERNQTAGTEERRTVRRRALTQQPIPLLRKSIRTAPVVRPFEHPSTAFQSRQQEPATA